MKTLVLYVFHELNDRVKMFIDKAIFEDKNVDFIIISNSMKKIKYPIPSYVKIFYRKNIGFDFGGWSDALLTDDLYKNYKNFIFVNSSSIGPFLKSGNKNKWTDIYIKGLSKDVKLFGSNIVVGYCSSDPRYGAFVQSNIFCMDINTLTYLIKCNIFIKNRIVSMNDCIDIEFFMSRKIIENKWNIGSLLPLYKDVDFLFRNKNPEDYNIVFYNDVMNKEYRNVVWNEYDLVFIKGNRGIDVEI